jgi:hypothetical protein
VLQELDLPQRPHTEHGVVERGDTFDGHLGSRRDMYGGSVTGTESNRTRSAVLGSAKMFGNIDEHEYLRVESNKSWLLCLCDPAALRRLFL